MVAQIPEPEANRHVNRVEIGDRAKKLERVAGDAAHQRRIERRHQVQAALDGHSLGEFERFLEVAAVLDQLRAERAHRGIFLAAVAMRHDYGRAHPGARRRIRDTLAMIAARRRD